MLHDGADIGRRSAYFVETSTSILFAFLSYVVTCHGSFNLYSDAHQRLLLSYQPWRHAINPDMIIAETGSDTMKATYQIDTGTGIS